MRVCMCVCVHLHMCVHVCVHACMPVCVCVLIIFKTLLSIKYLKNISTSFLTVPTIRQPQLLWTQVTQWWLSSCAMVFGRMFDNSFPACAFFFFFKVEISSRTLIPPFKPGSVHSGSASREDCDWVFPDELCVSLFPERFPHYVWTAAVSPLWLCWVKVICVFRCNLPPALLADWPGSFTCHCGNTGLERTPNKSHAAH